MDNKPPPLLTFTGSGIMTLQRYSRFRLLSETLCTSSCFLYSQLPCHCQDHGSLDRSALMAAVFAMPWSMVMTATKESMLTSAPSFW